MFIQMYSLQAQKSHILLSFFRVRNLKGMTHGVFYIQGSHKDEKSKFPDFSLTKTIFP